MSRGKRLICLTCERGVTLLEYGLLVALISVAALGGLRKAGRSSCQTMEMLACMRMCHGAPACSVVGQDLINHCRGHVYGTATPHGLPYSCKSL